MKRLFTTAGKTSQSQGPPLAMERTKQKSVYEAIYAFALADGPASSVTCNVGLNYGECRNVTLEERVFRALDAAGLITGAWHNTPYAELPESVREALDEAVWMVREHEMDSARWD